MTRPLLTAIKRGAKNTCPQCGKAPLFEKWLETHKQCASCGLEYAHQADDFPPYIVITIVGHIVGGLVLLTMKTIQLPLAAHFALWLPLTLILCVVLMRPIKGMVIALQWAKEMHGFEQKKVKLDCTESETGLHRK